MATTRQLRDKILEVAARAQELHPRNADARTCCFVARLSGAMQVLGELELDKALWDVVSNEQSPQSPADGA